MTVSGPASWISSLTFSTAARIASKQVVYCACPMLRSFSLSTDSTVQL